MLHEDWTCMRATNTLVAMVQLLFKGASVLVCSASREGGTPMHEAASTSSNEAVNELLRAGASPFVFNRHSTLHSK
jgi:ankyrin repeat protein